MKKLYIAETTVDCPKFGKLSTSKFNFTDSRNMRINLLISKIEP